MLLYSMSKVNKKNDINNLLINFIWSDIKKDIRSYPGGECPIYISEESLFFQPIVGELTVSVFSFDRDESLLDSSFDPLLYSFQLFFLQR